MDKRVGLQDEDKAFVSVIVPVYNGARHIQTCVEALLNQTYPRTRYEVLVVDNASTDSTRALVERYPVKLLTEDQIQSSYAARNRGLQHASGEVIAFTDSDCIPVPQWIEEGVRVLQSQSVDLLGGGVCFTYSARRTGAEIWDSLTNMQIEQNIRERRVAKTANLFVRSSVFERIGCFPNHLRSGGDVIWTSRATRKGFRLEYAPAAEVKHPARQMGALLRKQYRVGKGQVAIWRESDILWRMLAERTLRRFVPYSLSVIRSFLEGCPRFSGQPQVLWKVWLAAWLARMATSLGNTVAFLGLSRGRG